MLRFTSLMRTCLALVLLATVPALSQQAPPASTDIRVLERLAEERYADGDLTRAAELYLEIATGQVEPAGRARALFTAAWLLDLSGDRPRALTTLTDSLEIDPSQPFDDSLYNHQFELLYRQAMDLALRERRRQSAEKTQRASAAIRENRTETARSLLEQAIDLDADNPSALYNLALLDLAGGATETALADFERVISLSYQRESPAMAELRAKALTSIGIIYQQQKRLDDAEQSYREATRADATEPSAWRNLGSLYLSRSQYTDANLAFERARELLPDDPSILGSMARSLEATEQLDRAAILLSEHLERHPGDAELWLLLADIERQRDRTGAALDALQRCIDADAQNQSGYASSAAVLLARVQLEAGEVDAALSAANQALGWNRADPDAWSALGQAQIAAGQLPQAIASLNRAAELEPESLERQLALGAALVGNRQLPQAEAVYLKALTLDPSSTVATDALAQVREQLATERAIVAGKSKPSKPVPPKKIGLEFAGIDYKDLQLRGALVKNVNKKSPAARAGLRKGDLILWIGEYSVLSDKDFYQYLKRNPPSDRLTVEYLRDGRIHDAEIRLR